MVRVQKPHVILIFLLRQSLLFVNNEQSSWLLKLHKIVITMRSTSTRHHAHIGAECSGDWLHSFRLFVDSDAQLNNDNLSFQMVATSLTTAIVQLLDASDGSVVADIGCPAFLE